MIRRCFPTLHVAARELASRAIVSVSLATRALRAIARRSITPPAIALLILAFLATGCGSTRPGLGPAAKARPADIEALRAAAAAHPNEAIHSYRLGAIEAARGNVEAAERELRDALSRESSHAPSVSLLSKILYDTGRFSEGVQLLESQRALGSLPQELLVALALHYEALGEVEVADEIAGSLEPRLQDWERAGSAIAYLRLRGDRYQEALALAEKAVDARPDAVNHNNLGIAQLYAGEPVAAKKSFLRAHRLESGLAGPLYNLAIVDWFYFFEEDEARAWLRRYRKLSSEDPDGLAEILGVTVARGPDDPEEAMRMIAKPPAMGRAWCTASSAIGPRAITSTARVAFACAALLAVVPVAHAADAGGGAGSATPARSGDPPSGASATDGIKLLDPTNIEGEIRLPQVLFITSHESVRPIDYLEYYAVHAAAAAAGTDGGLGVVHVIRTDLRGTGAGQPGQPGTPGVPAVPGVPAIPAVPATPATPAIPGVPAVPADPTPVGAAGDHPSIESSTDHRSDTSGAAGRRAPQEGEQP